MGSSSEALLELFRERRRASVQQRERAAGRREVPAPLRWLRGQAGNLWYQQKVRRVESAVRRLGAARIVRQVPAFRGAFELDVRSHITRRIVFGQFEHALVPIVEAALGPGQHAIDIGANVGLYTVLCSKLIGSQGRLLAIEPVPAMIAMLRANIARNQLDNVTVFEGIATSQAGHYSINSPAGNEEYSSIAKVVHGSAPQQGHGSFQVTGQTLDELVEKAGLEPAFIKMDVEGAEGLVLTGARRVLERFRPTIMAEVNDELLEQLGSSALGILEQLTGLGYRVFEPESGEALGADTLPRPFSGEMVAVP